MNTVIKLCSDDFNVGQGAKGSILCTGIKGMSLVMFWSPGCKICTYLRPYFVKLPQIITGCKFGELNINENIPVIRMSKTTITSIENVPYIVFYVNGRPFLQYDDDADLNKIINFVQYTMKLVETKKQFIDKGARVESDVPKFTVGKGYFDFKCDDDKFCYLTAQQAYKQNTNK